MPALQASQGRSTARLSMHTAGTEKCTSSEALSPTEDAPVNNAG
jgi:hypothetical protein